MSKGLRRNLPRRCGCPPNRPGTTLLEVAIVLPVFFAFVFGIVEYGRVQMTSNLLKNACRQAARFGATEGVSCEEAKARLDSMLATFVSPQVVDVIIKDASVFDSGDTLPSTAHEFDALPSIELDDAEPRQLFLVRVSVAYPDIALLPIPGLDDMVLTGQAIMRHE